MSGEPLQRTVIVTNPQGFHLRPMAAFAQLATRFQSRVRVSREDKEVDGKSIWELMLLQAEPGTALTVHADGPDAGAALEALVALLQHPGEEGPPAAPAACTT
jgi:phosphotransferase system HPr (HPr) family protein